MLPAAALAGAFIVHGWPAQRFLIFYVAPLFFAAPLWADLRIRESGLAANERSIVDGAIVLLSFLRFVLGEILPFSGHMLFLSYAGITTADRRFRWLMLALLAETTVFKLWLWRDVYSWGLGLLIGVLVATYVRLQASRPAI